MDAALSARPGGPAEQPASSSADQQASRNRRCCGSISSASRREIRKNPASNSSTPRTRPAQRLELRPGVPGSGSKTAAASQRSAAISPTESTPLRRLAPERLEIVRAGEAGGHADDGDSPSRCPAGAPGQAPARAQRGPAAPRSICRARSRMLEWSYSTGIFSRSPRSRFTASSSNQPLQRADAVVDEARIRIDPIKFFSDFPDVGLGLGLSHSL